MHLQSTNVAHLHNTVNSFYYNNLYLIFYSLYYFRTRSWFATSWWANWRRRRNRRSFKLRRPSRGWPSAMLSKGSAGWSSRLQDGFVSKHLTFAMRFEPLSCGSKVRKFTPKVQPHHCCHFQHWWRRQIRRTFWVESWYF